MKRSMIKFHYLHVANVALQSSTGSGFTGLIGSQASESHRYFAYPTSVEKTDRRWAEVIVCLIFAPEARRPERRVSYAETRRIRFRFTQPLNNSLFRLRNRAGTVPSTGVFGTLHQSESAKALLI